MSEIHDLDALVPDPKTVRLGGITYTLPADLPMEVFLRLNKASELKDEDGSPDQFSQMEYLANLLADLFVWDVPADDRSAARQAVSDVLMHRGVKFSFELIRNLYPVQEDPNTDPPVPAPQDGDSNGTTSSST